MLSDFRRAEADYSRAIQLTPQYFDAFLSRAILYYTLKKSEESINDYNQALRYCADEDTIAATSGASSVVRCRGSVSKRQVRNRK